MLKTFGSFLLLLTICSFCTVTTGCDDDGGIIEGKTEIEIGDGDGEIIEEE